MISRVMMMNNLSKSLLKPMLKPFPRTLTTSITRSTLNNSSRIPYVRYYSDHPSPLQISQIESRVLQLLRDFDKVTADKLTLDAHFINDLGLDSLDQVEITMALEDEFNIEIPDKDAEEIFTVRQAVEKIFSNKNAM